jgi:S1-C subfamily serine protease
VGIVPTQVHPGTGEIMLGDIMTHIDGVPLRNATDYYLQLEKHQPGDTVSLAVVRNGEPRSLSVVLAKNVGS